MSCRTNSKREYKIPEELRSALETIANRLYAGHASVMIGAGFSRNADLEYPLWNQLGDMFYSRLNPGKSVPDGHYYDPMALADEMCSALGRTEMEHSVATFIGDGRVAPSKVHRMLLKLPWMDIFTTNYDTLLEASQDSAIYRKYSVVLRPEQLANAERPRIVKLHGSFPATTPFILTTEDYRKYPKTHAPFVNTVRQAFLENTFCLIGFSGSDPNFLSWVGWIRDNMGDYKQPIYMFSFDPLSAAQIQLLRDRGISVVDLRKIPGVKSPADYPQALCSVFDFLTNKRKEEKWTDVLSLNYLERFRASLNLEHLQQITKKWRAERYRHMGRLCEDETTRFFLNKELREWDYALGKGRMVRGLTAGLDFFIEYIFRLDVALMPLRGNAHRRIARILQAWKRLGEKLNTGKENEKDRPELKDFQNKLEKLALACLRAYREMGMSASWVSLSLLVSRYETELSPIVRQNFFYEQALFALTSFNIKKLRQILEEWPEIEEYPFGSVLKASLYCDLEDYATARIMLRNSLLRVRRKSTRNGSECDLLSTCQESVIIYSLEYCNNKLHVKSKEEEANLGLGDKYTSLQLIDRKNAIRGLGCDVMEYVKGLLNELEQGPKRQYSKTIKPDFDLGADVVTTSWNYPQDRTYAFWRLLEKIGLPVKALYGDIFSRATKGSFTSISTAMITSVCRYGETNKIDEIFTRELFLDLDSSVAEGIALVYVIPLLSRFGGKRANLEKELPEEATVSLIEILSRMCCKIRSVVARNKILEVIRVAYDNPMSVPWTCKINHLLKRFVQTSSDAELIKAIPILIEFEYVERTLSPNVLDERFRNPLLSVVSRLHSHPAGEFTLSDKKFLWLERAITESVEDPRRRAWYLITAVVLADINCLTRKQKKRVLDIFYDASVTMYSLGLIEAVRFSIIGGMEKRNGTWLDDYIKEKPLFDERDSNRTNSGVGMLYGRSNFMRDIRNIHDISKKNITQERNRMIWDKIKVYWEEKLEYAEQSAIQDNEAAIFGMIDVVREFQLRYGTTERFVASIIVPTAYRYNDMRLVKDIADFCDKMNESRLPIRAIEVSIQNRKDVLQDNYLIELMGGFMAEDEVLSADRCLAFVILAKTSSQRERKSCMRLLAAFCSCCPTDKIFVFVNMLERIAPTCREIDILWDNISSRLISLEAELDYHSESTLSITSKIRCRMQVGRLLKIVSGKSPRARASDLFSRWKNALTDINEFQEVNNIVANL